MDFQIHFLHAGHGFDLRLCLQQVKSEDCHPFKDMPRLQDTASSASSTSRAELLPYANPKVLAAKAKAARPAVPEFDELLVENFASGKSSGRKVPWHVHHSYVFLKPRPNSPRRQRFNGHGNAALLLKVTIWCFGLPISGLGGNTRPTLSGTFTSCCEHFAEDWAQSCRRFPRGQRLNVSHPFLCWFLVRRMYNHNLGETEWQQIPVIFPDDMAVALYKQGDSIFRKVMYGDSDPVAFWTHCIEHSQWFKDHPLSKYPNYNGLIPISVYGTT